MEEGHDEVEIRTNDEWQEEREKITETSGRDNSD